MKLVFATNNPHKIEEVRSVIGDRYEIITLQEAGINTDIPEPHDTIEENASEKSRTIYKLTGHDCFSEDTGLEVYALNGEPGVKSARYAGDEKSFAKNIQKLLMKMEGQHDRRARFRAVISLLMDGEEHQFEGICEGFITKEPKGSGGFGYDSVFVPVSETRTFAEMTLAEKTIYSHRRIATDKLVTFLQKPEINPQN